MTTKRKYLSILFVFLLLLLTTVSTVSANNQDPLQGFWDGDFWDDLFDFWDDEDNDDNGGYDDDDSGDYDDNEHDSNGTENSGKTVATPGAQPWMVALVDRDVANAYDGQFCGGSLIGSEWVLTAAHCLEDTEVQTVDAVIGRFQLSSSNGERIQVDQIIIHPQYDADLTENDIALLHLSRAATAGTPIDIIDVAREQYDDPGLVAHVTGWGVIPENGDNFPDKLHGVDILIATQTTCSNAYDETIPGMMLCAGQPEGGADSCQGDSGGPLVVRDGNGGWLQAGIVSWGDLCGAPNSYGVYTRLTEFDPWINQILGGDVAATAVIIASEPASAPSEAEVGNVGEVGVTTPTPSMGQAVSLQSFTLVDSGFEQGEQFATYENGDSFVEIIANSSYGSLDEWLDEIEVDPFADEWHTTNNVEFVLIDWSDSDGAFSEAMFYLDGQLINIYGNVSPEKMMTIVTDYLS